MTLSRRCLLLGLLAGGAGFVCRAAGQSDPGADSTVARSARGRSLFEGKGLCFSCHGKNGEGLLGPSTRLASRPVGHTRPSVADVAALIKSAVDSAHSISGQLMPARGGSRLNDAEVEAVATYVLELEKGRKPE